MKNLLITGKNGYIAQQFEQFIRQFPDEYHVTSVSLRNGDWRELALPGYDVILHTAGIAHIRERRENSALYYEVNRDLTIELAQMAKDSGVKQFVFLSSISIYGMDEGVITPGTVPNPVSSYGKSKLQAEEGILPLQAEDFTVSVLRPPMVYGSGCKGNYRMLEKIARISPVFPDYQNQRSMVSIETLCGFIKNVIDENTGGVFVPQEADYVCTSKMVQRIAANMGREIKLVRWLNPAASMAARYTRAGKKAFGNLILKY